MPAADEVEYLTVRQIASQLDASESTVRGYFKTGALPGGKFGKGWRIRKDDLDAWLRAGGASQIPSPR